MILFTFTKEKLDIEKSVEYPFITKSGPSV